MRRLREKQIVRVGVFVCLSGLSSVGAQKGAGFVRGGQFKDLILPVPIVQGLEKEGLWGNDKVLPRDRDNGVEDNEWCYWGGNPILGNDGKYHIAVCRWPERTGHHGWFESEVAHGVSEGVLGPYRITGTIVKKGHNPEVMKMPDGSYVLHVMTADVFQAADMPGPWKRIGKMRLDSRGFRPNNRLGSNLTTEFRPDGSILLMKKNGDIAISRNGILGPYRMVSINNYTRTSGYAEDPVVWRSRHQYHCIYNHAQDRKSAYMRSLDGIHWKHEEGLPYDASTTFYEDGTKNEWYKFERPKVLQDEQGSATHLSLALLDVAKGADKGNDNHSSKNMILPLVVERLVSIENREAITVETKTIVVRIAAEEGLDPVRDLVLESLRFGSDSVVNHGGGCEAVRSKADGKDLLVEFEGDHGLNRFDYDFKLIGQTKKGGLVYGFALLPGKSPTAASLITLPVTVQSNVLESMVENWGLETSEPIEAAIMEHRSKGWKTLETIKVPALAPYGSHKLSVPIKPGNGEYEVRLLGRDSCIGYWRMVDELHSSVRFSGDWKPHEKPDARCFMDNEQLTETEGASVTFSFTGTQARAYGYLGNEMGAFDVFIDGDYVENIRLSYGGPFSQLYETARLPEGGHTFELRAAKAKHERTGSRVAIDAFAYESMNNK